MSLLPYLLEAELRPRRRMRDQDLGLVLAPEEFLLSSPLARAGDCNPWRQLSQLSQLGRDLAIKADKNKFQINMDVQHFSPEEISVKTANGYVVVEGNHEERQDEHGFVSRKFVRRYALPEGCDPDTVVSRLSSDGVLTVEAPRVPPPPALEGERQVKLEHTGPVRKQINDQQ